MTTATAPSDSTRTTAEALYVYGIVKGDIPLETLADDSGMGEGVRLVSHGRVGAIVEPVDPDRPLGRRRDLVAHSSVLDGLAADHPVLPMQFGSVVSGTDAVRDELLAPQEEYFAGLLDRVAGKHQFTVRARYVLDTVLAEIVEQDPEVARLRELTADQPEEAFHSERIRLGQLVAAAVEERRGRDAERVLQALLPYAEAHVTREVSGMDDLTEVSLLVTGDGAALEQAAETLAAELHGYAQLTLVGPMALYDFLPDD